MGDRRSFVDRLRHLSPRTPGTTRGGSSPSETIEALRWLVARTEARARPQLRRPLPIERVVRGSFLTTPHGPLFMTRTETPLSVPRGRWGPPLATLRAPFPPVLGHLIDEEGITRVSPSGMLFLDTETTGLATTSGTLAFLVGTGFVEGDLFVVEQFFARDFDEEPALLWALAQRLGGVEGMVTYNGRAFDVPLLLARFVTNRVFDPPLPPLHLDMLHPARRLWRRRTAGCSLTSLERVVLGVEREDDVPGELIPGLYFDALASGDATRLSLVFAHNVNDLLSLAGLTAEACRLLGAPLSGGARAEDLFSVARIFEPLEREHALGIYRAAARGEWHRPDTREEALVRLGLLLRRLGRGDEACEVFWSLAKESASLRPFCLVELAKHLEHERGAFDQALLAARAALDALQEAEGACVSPRAEYRVCRHDVEARIARLSARTRGLPWRRRAS